MNKRRSVAQFNVLSHRGNIHPSIPTFKSGLFTQTNGTYSQVSDDEVIAAALRILSNNLIHGPALLNPKATRDYLTMRFSQLEHEIFACLYLDNRHHVIACEELFRGTIDGANVHPREVVKRALSHNAAAVILSHNHPSGLAEPSSSDQLITKRLKEALSLVDIRVLDHLIVGGPHVESFAERGLL